MDQISRGTIAVIRSEPTTQRRLADQYRKWFNRDKEFEIGHRAWEFEGCLPYWRLELDSLAAMDIGPEISIAHDCEDHIASTPIVSKVWQQYSAQTNRMSIEWTGIESDRHRSRKMVDELTIRGEDFSVGVGWRLDRATKRGSYHCNFGIENASIACDDLGYRCDLFQRAVVAMGLGDAVYPSINNGKLKLAARDPWVVTPGRAEMDGTNAGAFQVCGFPDT